jgi:hypothetical protein
MSRRPRPHYRPDLGWNLGVAFADTLTRSDRLAQGFTFVRCCGSPRASSPHGLAAPGLASHDGRSLRAVASGSRLLPTRPAKDFHLQSSAHARHTCTSPCRSPVGQIGVQRNRVQLSLSLDQSQIALTDPQAIILLDAMA